MTADWFGRKAGKTMSEKANDKTAGDEPTPRPTSDDEARLSLHRLQEAEKLTREAPASTMTAGPTRSPLADAARAQAPNPGPSVKALASLDSIHNRVASKLWVKSRIERCCDQELRLLADLATPRRSDAIAELYQHSPSHWQDEGFDDEQRVAYMATEAREEISKRKRRARK